MILPEHDLVVSLASICQIAGLMLRVGSFLYTVDL
jgi:hypothetical protein